MGGYGQKQQKGIAILLNLNTISMLLWLLTQANSIIQHLLGPPMCQALC